LRENQQEKVEAKPGKKKGAWKVSDDTLLEFIASAKKAVVNDAEEVSTVGRSSSGYVPVGRTMLGNTGGNVVTSLHMSSSPGKSMSSASEPLLSPAKVSARSQSKRVGAASGTGLVKPGGIRCRNAYPRQDLSARPPWAKCQSMPNLFARVASGLDGKGNKLVSETGKFEETPIYLGDRNDKCFERVRVAVCGHPYYMNRK